MKTKIIKLSIILIVFNLLNGCDWMYNTPVTGNVSLHKTKGDYRHLYMIRMSGDEIWAKNCWERDKTLWSGLNEDTIYTGRQKVVNGYVLDGPAKLTDVYLSLTFKEVLLKEIAMNNPGHALPYDTLRKYILDKDPYLELYRCITTFTLEDSVEISEIIRNGEIGQYFERLK